MILYKSPAGAVAVLPDHFSVSLRFLFFSLAPSFLFLFPLSFLFIESTRISPCAVFLLCSHLRDSIHDSRRVRAPRTLRLSFEARDRHSYQWQRDSFVLSRRFQLIFIVYLPDQRYLEDNGPPRYIRSEPYHANTEVYLLSLPASGRSSHRTRV